MQKNRLTLTKSIIITALLSLCSSVFAETTADSRVDLSLIEVTPHELAFTQVLAEICPTLLNATQQRKFTTAYQTQLQSFMPTLNTAVAMRQISSQKQYRKILRDMRQWTLSFPKEENRALCIEFAEASF